MNTRFVSVTGIMSSAAKGLLLAWLLSVAGCAILPKSEVGGDGGSEIRVITVDADVQKMFNQAVTLMRQKQYRKAIVLLSQVVSSEQRLTAPYINLAIAHEQTGDRKQAQESLDKALAIDPYDPDANNEQGLIYRKQGRFDLAKKAYTTAIEKNPDHLPVVRNLAILCDLYLRDLECAMEQYERYQELSPGDEQIRLWIADLKHRTGG